MRRAPLWDRPGKTNAETGSPESAAAAGPEKN